MKQEIPYPEKIYEVMDKYFPKGKSKKRGDALVVQAISFIEGKEYRNQEIIQIIDEMLEENDKMVEQGKILPKDVHIPFINAEELKKRMNGE